MFTTIIARAWAAPPSRTERRVQYERLAARGALGSLTVFVLRNKAIGGS
jgi:hypothetical protein